MSPGKAATRANKNEARKARTAAQPRGAAAARSAAIRQARVRRERRIRVVKALGVLGLVAAIGLSVTAIVRNQMRIDNSTVAVDGVASFSNSAGHVTTPVDYPQTPPAGGPHNPIWLNCGVYNQPVEAVNAVHGMEHGAVWITYRPDLPASDVARLRQITSGQVYEYLSPFPDLSAPVVVSAWNKQLTLTGATDPRLADFVAMYKQGKDAPEPGAPCTGGTGTPTT